MDTREQNLRDLQENLHDLREQVEIVAQRLNDVAKEFQEHFKNCHIATIVGSSAGVVGGVISAVGFGLAFFTGGASLGLTAVGIAIGSAGGLITTSTSIAESILRSHAYKDAEKLLKTFEKTRSEIIIRCNHIIQQLGQEGLERSFILLATFFSRFIGGKAGISVDDACEIIRNTASVIQQGGEPAYKIALGSAGTTGRVTSAVAKSLGSTSKAMHVAGGVVGIALIPVDIGFIVHSAVAVAKDKQSETAKKISDMAEKLLEMSPSEGEIDEIINDTIGRLMP